MMALIATVAVVIGIIGLFVLERDAKARPSMALFIPLLWLLINGSRPVSQWLQMGVTTDTMESANAILDGSPLDASVFTALLAIALVVVIWRGQKVVALLRGNPLIVLFFLYCLVSVAWSDYPFVAFKRWTKAIGDLAMVLIALTDPVRETALKRLLAWIGFLLMPVSVLFIKYYPDLGRGYSRWDGTLFNTGVTTNKNTLGMICMIVGLGALWRVFHMLRAKKSARPTKQLIAQASLLGFVLWLLWLCNSMTSLSCFLMGSSLIVATSFPTLVRKRAVLHLLVVAALAVSSSALFFDLGGDVLKTMGRDTTLTGRTDVWNAVLHMTQNPILGAGFESFWLGPRLDKLWSMFWWHPNEAHNGYLEVFLNLGWVGIALLTSIIITGYRNLLSMLRWNPEACGLRMAFFVAALAYNFTEAGFRIMSPVWIFFLVAAVAVPKPRVAKAAEKGEAEKTNLWSEVPAPVPVGAHHLRHI